MNLGLVLKRIRREWRQFIVLIVAICLVTAFFSLGPLYARAAIQSGLQFAVNAAGNSALNLSFVSPTAYKNESWDAVNQQLGPLNAGLIRISRSAAAFGGFQFTYGTPTDEFTARSATGYRVYAFSNMRDILKLTSGRWPDRLAPSDSPERQASSDDERKAKGLGIYSTGDVEAVITSDVAKAANVEIGTRLSIGEKPENHVVVNIVGIVAPVNPDDPIWADNDLALTGETVQSGVGAKQYNMAMFVTEGAYSDWIAKATEPARGGDNNSYVWQIKLNPQAITADNVSDVQARLSFLVNKMTADYPSLLTFNPLSKVLSSYMTDVSGTEKPVILLSGAILVLMLYHLVTTVSLALEQQMGEWSSLSSRGASTFQLVMLQGLSMILLGAIGFAAGPFLALGILAALVRIGPLAGSAGSSGFSGVIPQNTVLLSAIAAIAAIVVLTLPAISAARRSMAQFKQIVSRPPTRPAWMRYWLDLILIVVGVGFIGRLLFFVTGDLGQALSLFANNPQALIGLILDSANQTGGLSDPLNLLGPALLLTGIALLWLRIFPALMRLIGGIFSRSDRLTGPLALWNVERDPSHYAQLVLLLIGTLALGTAALALNTTRDSGTWSAAELETGGAARIDFNEGANIDADTLLKLPGVNAAALITRAETDYTPGLFQTFLVGINAADLAKNFPDLADEVAPLIGQSAASGGNSSQGSAPAPVIMSQRMAVDEGRAVRSDRLPLQVGATGQVELLLSPGRSTMLNYTIVGIVRDFPTLASDQHFLIVDPSVIAQVFNVTAPTQAWLDLPAREPSAEMMTAIKAIPGTATFAWERYNELLREPLPAAVAGMLYAGFWVSLVLSLLDFGFYLAVTARRRSLGFAVLQAMGWNSRNIWALLAIEQIALVVPAMIVGTALGAALAYVILPFLALVGRETLRLPVGGMAGLLLILMVGFGVLLNGAAWWLRRLNVNWVLRLGEE